MKHPLRSADDVAGLRFDADGLVPVVAQDEVTGAVLMVAYANAAALRQSLASRRMTYWSRSRQALWTKGETSGHTQEVVSLAADCDLDAVLAVVRQQGPACHEGTGSCFTADAAVPVATTLGVVERVAVARRLAPAGRYTDRLLADASLAAAKVEEEAGEVAAVLRGEEHEDPLAHEAADLLYHLVVALRGADLPLAAALQELAARHRGAPTTED